MTGLIDPFDLLFYYICFPECTPERSPSLVRIPDVEKFSPDQRTSKYTNVFILVR